MLFYMGMGWPRKVVGTAVRTAHPCPPGGTELGRYPAGGSWEDIQRKYIPGRAKAPKAGAELRGTESKSSGLGETTGRGAPVSHSQDLAFPSEWGGKKATGGFGEHFQNGLQGRSKENN